MWQVGSARIRGARFPFSLVGIGRSDEQSLSRYAVGEAGLCLCQLRFHGLARMSDSPMVGSRVSRGRACWRSYACTIPCSFVVVDGAWSFASKVQTQFCPSGNEPMQRKQTAPLKADSTLRTSRAPPHYGKYYRDPVPVNFRARRDPVLSGIDVSVLGIDVFCTCVEQLHWAVTERNQSSRTMAIMLWLHMQSLYFSVRFPEADSGKSGRRASVLQVLLSAYLHLADFMRRS